MSIRSNLFFVIVIKLLYLIDLLKLHATARGLSYPLVGGTRQRHFAGINFKPRKLLENAPTPTTMAPALFAGDRVHAVLACYVGWGVSVEILLEPLVYLNLEALNDQI